MKHLLLKIALPICLIAVLSGCRGAGQDITPPYSPLSTACTEDDVIKEFGTCDAPQENTAGGTIYNYDHNYLGYEGEISYSFLPSGKLYSIYWMCNVEVEEDMQTIRQTLTEAITEQGAKPSQEKDLENCWKIGDYMYSIMTVSVFNVNHLAVACVDTSEMDKMMASDSSGKAGTSVSAPAFSGTTYGLNETAVGDGFSLTVDSVDATPEFLNYNPADSGFTYFFASFELENTGTDPLSLGNLFTVYADGEECELIHFGDPYNSVECIATYTDLEPGRKAKNYLSATIPENWNEVHIICEDGTSFLFTTQDLGDISAVPAAQGNGSEATVCHVGDTITRNGIDIKLTRAVQTDYISYLSTMYYEPEPGNHYIVLFFDIKNNSNQSQQFDTNSIFDLYVNDYSSFFTGLSAEIDGIKPLNDQQYTDILPGKSMSGYEVVEAQDEKQKIELVGRQGTFEITPDQVTGL